MRIQVDPASPLPLYAQLADRLRRAIALGELVPGQQLPTVRQFAVDLRINPNTVARAYAELEREGALSLVSSGHAGPTAQQLSLFSPEPHPVIEALRQLDANSLTPLEAISKLYELTSQVQREE